MHGLLLDVSKKNLRQTLLLGEARPIEYAEGWPDKFPAKDHCSRCGLCETTFVSSVVDACAFLDEGMHRIEAQEQTVHGRSRQEKGDEERFGVLHSPIRLARGINMPDAQWTGVVTSIALSLLESGEVDAVVCIGGSFNDPRPILARTPSQVLEGRGVKPVLAPSLAVLDQIQQDSTIRRLCFCGVGCAIQALRAVEDDLDLEELFVLGTNCVDNSPTPEAAANFMQEGLGIPADQATGYEFMQDFKVHVKTKTEYIQTPYFSLPGTIAEPSIARSCRACFDYTNALTDVTVGYMGAPLKQGERMNQSWQTLTVRNERGARMVERAIQQGRLRLGEVAEGSGDHEKLAMATLESDAIVQDLLGEPIREKGMPSWIAGIMAAVVQLASPKGLSFAKYSIDYHVLRNYLHVLNEYGPNNSRLPKFAQDLVYHYLEKFPLMREYHEKVLSTRTKQGIGKEISSN